MTLKPDYPRFQDFGQVSYRVGREIIELVLDPTFVFPPSETTLTLAEAISGLKATSVLDIGTGSGLLAIVAAKRGCLNVWAIDKNPKAVECASINARRNGVRGSIHFEVADVLSWETDRKFDLVVTNPPFMPMPVGAKFISDEINLAINGGTDGTEMLIAFAEKAASLLTYKGRLVFGLPHFVSHAKVVDYLSTIYSMRVILKRDIRYWLAEYDEGFAKHIDSLVATKSIEVFKDGKYLMTTLSIFECHLLERHF